MHLRPRSSARLLLLGLVMLAACGGSSSPTPSALYITTLSQDNKVGMESLNPADGALRWKQLQSASGYPPLIYAPLVSGTLVFTATLGKSLGNSLVAVDAHDGKPHWTISSVAILVQPVLADQVIYIDYLDLQTPTPPGHSGHWMAAVRAQDGTFVWRTELDKPSIGYGESFTLGLGNIYVSESNCFDTCSEFQSFVALRASDGQLLWQNAIPGSQPFSPATVTSDAIYIFEPLGMIVAFRPTDGHQLWQRAGGPIVLNPLNGWPADWTIPPLALHGMVYIRTTDGSLIALNGQDGTVRWQMPAAFYRTDEAVAVDDSNFYVPVLTPSSTGFTIQLIALRLSDGHIQWQIASVPTKFFTSGGRLYGEFSGKPNGVIVIAFDATNGRMLWKTTLDNSQFIQNSAAWSDVTMQKLSDGVLYASFSFDGGGGSNTNYSSLLWAVRATDGHPLWHTQVDGNIIAITVAP